MSTDANKWHSKWWATGLLLPILATLAADYFNKVPIWSTIIKVFVAVKNFTISILVFQIQLWVIVVVIALFLFFRQVIKQSNKKNAANSPDFLEYKRDRLKRWVWTWEYKLNRNYKYNVVNMKPVCDVCDTKMLGNGDFYNLVTKYKCPRCDAMKDEYSRDFEYENDIEALILENIDKRKEIPIKKQ